MSASSILLPQTFTRHERLRHHLRLPIVLLAFGLILYFLFYVSAYVPTAAIFYEWRPDHVMRVYAVETDATGPEFLQPGDIILAINGEPVRRKLFSPLFPPPQHSREFTIRRGEMLLNLIYPPSPPDWGVIRSRLTTGLVALLAWLVGALILTVALPDNRDAWQLGLAILLAAVVLMASEGALYGVPGAWLLSNPLFPLVAVSWAHVAMLPRNQTPSSRERPVFGVLYSIAAFLGLVALYELLVLDPQGTSIAQLSGISWYEVLLLCIALGVLGHLVIIGWRFWRTPPSYLRQQLLIVLFFTSLAYLPSILLTVLPRIFFDITLIPWELSITLFALSPAGYGFVIYRRKYFGLDLFITHTLTLLLVGLLLLSIYSVLVYLVQHSAAALIEEPTFGFLFLFPLLFALPYLGQRMRRVIDSVIFGPGFQYRRALAHFTTRLSHDPQLATLSDILTEISELLQVRQLVLMKTTQDDRLVMTYQLRVEEAIDPFSANRLPQATASLSTALIARNESDHFLFSRYPWVYYLVPLITQGRVTGLLLLSRPVPDGYLNARQVEFVQQVADMMAVSLGLVQLFEASRQMSRDGLRVRDEERTFLATQLHDEPLQRISVLASQLHQLATTPETDPRQAIQLAVCTQDLQIINAQIRDICAGLYPPVVQQGPQWAVREVVADFQTQHQLDIALTVSLDNELLVPEPLTKVIYYLLSEALTNIVKHAQASQVWVALSHQEGSLRLTIIDNGQVPSPGSLSLPDLLRAGHFGLVGMVELATSIGGQLQIGGQAGGGTKVQFEAPLVI